MTLHFLRPEWWALCIPILLLGYFHWRKPIQLRSWQRICDPHLLTYLVKAPQRSQNIFPLGLLLLSALFLVIGLTGPTWRRLPVPSYHQILPRVALLDMSEDMLITDLSPNRLSRAKFKLHDLLKLPNLGQLGVIAYTELPFVVAPLTEDGATLDGLLDALTPEIMPVKGNRLDRALTQAARLLNQAGYSQGQLLVLTSNLPSPMALDVAQRLNRQGLQISILPILPHTMSREMFAPFAKAGGGEVLDYSDTLNDLQLWLKRAKFKPFTPNTHNDIPTWRDEGRWFIIPALVLLLPAFRRGWFARIGV